MEVIIVNSVGRRLRRNPVLIYMGKDDFIKSCKWRINSKSRSKKILFDLIMKSFTDQGDEVIIVEGDNLNVNETRITEKGEEYLDRMMCV
jgi:hypothetical protein